MSESVFATPRNVRDVSECIFYHTMDLPGIGEVQGQFDLRGREAVYLGNVDLDGKRVLEVGPANGHLSLYMERQGAEVVSCDLSKDISWDFVPYARVDHDAMIETVRGGIDRINNGYWLAHRLHESRNRVVYSSVYDIPDAIGRFDVGTLCATLLHMENPFRAIESVARRTRDKIVITEILGPRNFLSYQLSRWFRPAMRFLPNAREPLSWNGHLTPDRIERCMVWWTLTPDVIRRFLGVVGFERSDLRYHRQSYQGRKLVSCTVVGHRTVPLAD
ncbi:MAG: hypothetical protein CMJ83_09420 [Planctomycetes bacterium]|nr:hypothetical protein [Planctomycetota bacterium]